MKRGLLVLFVVGTAVLAQEKELIAPSTVAVTVQTDDGASFRLTGRTILPDTAVPDTVTVEIWKNGTKTTHWFVAVPDSDAVRLLLALPVPRNAAK